MNFVYLENTAVQSLIKHNARLIRELETERNHQQYLVDTFWKAADPIDKSPQSKTAFECLNKAKNNLQRIKKRIKLLSEVQYALKYSQQI